MAIPNNQSENKEVRHESYTDINGNTRTHLTETTETVNNSTANPNSYQNGYSHGRSNERSYQQAYLAERDNENAGRGLLLGIIFTSLVALTVGGVWYFNQRNNATVDNNADSATPVLVPVPGNSSPAPSASPQPETRIIERTREVPVPIPQQIAPPAPSSSPNINITVPPQPPAVEKAPSATQAAPTDNTSIKNKSEITNTPAPSTNGDSFKTTPPQGTDQSNSTSNNDSSTTGDTSTGGSAQ